MDCPNCKKEIPEEDLKKEFAARGGRASRRTISKEAQAKMQAARKAKKQKGNDNDDTQKS